MSCIPSALSFKILIAGNAHLVSVPVPSRPLSLEPLYHELQRQVSKLITESGAAPANEEYDVVLTYRDDEGDDCVYKAEDVKLDMARVRLVANVVQRKTRAVNDTFFSAPCFSTPLSSRSGIPETIPRFVPDCAGSGQAPRVAATPPAATAKAPEFDEKTNPLGHALWSIVQSSECRNEIRAFFVAVLKRLAEDDIGGMLDYITLAYRCAPQVCARLTLLFIRRSEMGKQLESNPVWSVLIPRIARHYVSRVHGQEESRADDWVRLLQHDACTRVLRMFDKSLSHKERCGHWKGVATHVIEHLGMQGSLQADTLLAMLDRYQESSS